MIPNLKKRLIVSILTIATAAICGTLFGYLLARAFLVQVTEAKLDQYATRIVADGDAYSSELRTVLAAADASQQSSCSDAEIEYFRALIFESDFIKDAGRIHDGNINCSAALGRPNKVSGRSTSAFTQQDGTQIYRSLAPYNDLGLTILGLQSGNFFVAFTPHSRIHLEPAPLHFFKTKTDINFHKSDLLMSDQPLTDMPMLTSEGQGRVRNYFYATRCSIRFFKCVTAYAAIPEIIQAHRTKYYGCITLCGLAGALFGVFLSLLYRHNRSLEQQLRRSIRDQKIEVAYQPIVDLKNRRIVGAEALARWRDEEGNQVSPEIFIRIAEEHGFIGEITKLMVHKVLHECNDILRVPSGPRISVNAAAEDLSDPGFLPMLEQSINQSGVSPSRLAIEITEGSTARHEIALITIHQLRQRGHAVLIDDFGTGYSSLAYLHELSVDAIKIDRSFTQAVGTDSAVVAILPQILSMVRALDLQVIVEGIETVQQAAYFTSVGGRTYGQGWLFGRPVPAEDFRSLIINMELKSLSIVT